MKVFADSRNDYKTSRGARTSDTSLPDFAPALLSLTSTWKCF
ncbi:hypothetical protein HSB1_47400 [Halogranum salarium B-1]|uniref:Uncharacterized protein n=1 Tax=Halogranum salarium B-1 TaxID=1210908 RepID=J2ZV56_9EURY|nr:hypothetical protein HSB1_47400 [Halogranum salarium B-1]